MASLDRSRPFGEVCGALEDGTRFFQDDKRFDADGAEIGTPAKKPRAKAPAQPTKDD